MWWCIVHLHVHVHVCKSTNKHTRVTSYSVESGQGLSVTLWSSEFSFQQGTKWKKLRNRSSSYKFWGCCFVHNYGVLLYCIVHVYVHVYTNKHTCIYIHSSYMYFRGVYTCISQISKLLDSWNYKINRKPHPRTQHSNFVGAIFTEMFILRNSRNIHPSKIT